MANIFKFGGRRKNVNFGGNLIWRIFTKSAKSAKISSPKVTKNIIFYTLTMNAYNIGLHNPKSYFARTVSLRTNLNAALYWNAPK